jgi:hypothetical protein
VSSGERGIYLKVAQVPVQSLQELRHHRDRTEVSDDPHTVAPVDERHYLVAHDMVGEQHRVGRKLFLNFR